MIRRNIHYRGFKGYNYNPCYPNNETSQIEPNLHDILVMYNNGQDVSEFIVKKASSATADLQFMNRVGKVDYLTEMSDLVKNKVSTAKDKFENEVTQFKQKQELEKSKQNVESQELEKSKQNVESKE